MSNERNLTTLVAQPGHELVGCMAQCYSKLFIPGPQLAPPPFRPPPPPKA